jgi:hypothetical protein
MQRSLSNDPHKRGQILSSEFIIAAVIFMFVLGAILFMWTTTTLQINQSELVYTMDESATSAAEKLVRTGGLPRNWSKLDADDIAAIGLVNESRILDLGKLDRFLEMMNDSGLPSDHDNPCGFSDPLINNYGCNKHFLGLGKYDFHFNMTYLNGTFIGQTGVQVPSDADFIISKRRTALLNDRVVIITLSVWYQY